MATGLHTLLVVSSDGIDGLYQGFLDAENRPNTDAEGNVLTANAVMGVCMLAGTSEVVPANALPIWSLFGQGESLSQAYSGLSEDWEDLKQQAEDAVADTEALATKAWEDAEDHGEALVDKVEAADQQVLDVAALTVEQARELARGDVSAADGRARQRARARRGVRPVHAGAP